MIRTNRGTRVRLIRHEQGSQYVRCRRLDDGTEFDWKISELAATDGAKEINEAIARLDEISSASADEGVAR